MSLRDILLAAERDRVLGALKDDPLVEGVLQAVGKDALRARYDDLIAPDGLILGGSPFKDMIFKWTLSRTRRHGVAPVWCMDSIASWLIFLSSILRFELGDLEVGSSGTSPW